MQQEVPWKVVGPVVVVLLAIVVYAFFRMTAEGTVSEREIRAPAPPGGFPKGKAPAIPAPQ